MMVKLILSWNYCSVKCSKINKAGTFADVSLIFASDFDLLHHNLETLHRGYTAANNVVSAGEQSDILSACISVWF